MAELFVPGRLCLLGEHSDWAGGKHRLANENIPKGYCVVCATNEGLYGRVQPFNDNMLRYEHIDGVSGDVSVLEVSLDNPHKILAMAKERGFFSYVCGTVHHMLPMLPALPIRKGVLICNYRTTLPMKKGLSSSAAICVLVARALDTFYSLRLDRDTVMDCAFQGEISTGVQCGRMDQAVAMGANKVGLMEFDGDRCVLSDIAVGATLHFVVVDLRRGKDTAKILADLNACFPFPRDATQRKMHTYVERNVELVLNAVAAIRGGQVGQLSECMRLAQESFDACAIENCPDQLTAPRLHGIMGDESLRAVSLAVKGVGSQGDGCAQVLCAGPAEQARSLEVLRSLGCEGFLLTVPATEGLPAGGEEA